jgi:acetyl-CoA carboxylase biotin carboxylase subunit
MLPGTPGTIAGIAEARDFARTIGYPVVVKAVAGGGGRGMRVALNEEELVRGLPMAQSEAEAAFGNGAVYMERYLQKPRHVEVQVLGDHHGNVVAVGERDCSLQRRHQKVVEEAPAPNLPRKTRDNLLKTAVKGARAAGYTSAGTLEFLLDSDGKFYFMEMNTRIQVEHTITEETSRIDLVAWQIRVAAGERITFREEDLRPVGHSIECRITAEDANNDFMPAVGTVETYVAPGGPGVRVDSHLFSGYSIPPNYDSLLGKIIVWGKDRDEAVARMERALSETIITGVTNTIPFLAQVIGDGHFKRSDVHTGFIPEFMERAGNRTFDQAEDPESVRPRR